ncbi:hypothetical protein [Streptomyces sp. CA-251251]|uniref:hypothetical protein n=1 Tax=Streptomyces sp. CA-251251 TaxID=3240063 RepID=UPI003D90842B
MRTQPGAGRPEREHPLVREVFPELVAELTTLLEDEGESELALCARDLRLVEECGCGDGFCQSIRTADRPRGQPYGPGHRCVPLSPAAGMLILDVVDGRIVYVEILDRPPLHRRVRRAGAGGTAGGAEAGGAVRSCPRRQEAAG